VSDELPGGMMQRIIIARALARNARVLLFDEANAGLDRKADTQLMDALAKLKGTMTIVAVSHRPSLIRMADRVVSIHKGKARLNHSFAPPKASPAPAQADDGDAAAAVSSSDADRPIQAGGAA
jgi:ABC-type bacteriocin/lantibiotic exporter with double-glycine peptidase domain